jgi:hypothetical protein
LIALLLLPGSVLAEPPPEDAEVGIFTGKDVMGPVGKGFDAVILRPLGVAALLVGVGLFVPAGLLSLADYPDTTKEAWELFVTVPAESLYRRPLGEF